MGEDGNTEVRAMPSARSGELRSEPVPVSAVPAPATIAEVLNRAADLLEPEGVWNCKNCAATAIWEAMGSFVRPDSALPAEKAFATLIGVEFSALPYGIYRWNDAPERAQAEVVAKLREAAALASTDRELEA